MTSEQRRLVGWFLVLAGVVLGVVSVTIGDPVGVLWGFIMLCSGATLLLGLRSAG